MGKGLAGTALGISIAALILGWIPFVGWLIWIAGLVLAIVAIVKCKTPEDGKGLAIAALAVMIVSFLITALLAVIGGLAYFGVLSPSKFLPESFTLQGGFSPAEFLATPIGVNLVIVDDIGAATVESITLAALPGSEVPCNTTTPVNQIFEKGERYAFQAYACGGTPGQTLHAKVDVRYVLRNETALRVASGKVYARVK